MNDAKRAGENAESKPLNLRLPHAVSDQLQALADSLPIVSKHRLAVEALRLGLAALAADPSILLRGASTPSTPSTSAPAAPAAPAPMRPVVSRVEAVEPPAAAPVDPRQLPLPAPVAPVVALHKSTHGHSVATITGNDNATSTPKPKRARRAVKTADANVVDLDALKARLAAAVAAGHTLKALSREGKFSDSSVVMWRNGRRASIGPEVAAKLDAVLTSHGF